MTARQSVLSTPVPEHSRSDSGIRKRVYKACDRCRLKKSKCDGEKPCSRCRTDNKLCIFGRKKKPQNKVYPKGYVEMLEQQQIYLVNGLQELYQRLLKGESWQGKPLTCKSNRQPLIHDLLTQLGALDQSKHEQFIDNSDTMQQELWKKNIRPAQHQDTDGSKNTHSLTMPSQLSDLFPMRAPSQTRTPTTLGIEGPHSAIKSELHMMSESPAYIAPMQTITPPCLVDLSDLDLQNAQLPTMQLPPSHDFGNIGDFDIRSSQYGELLCDDSIMSAVFDRETAIGCLTPGPYTDNKNTLGDIRQFPNMQLESAS